MSTGNENFSKVENVTGTFSELVLSDGKVSHLHAEDLHAEELTTNGVFNRFVAPGLGSQPAESAVGYTGDGLYKQVIGYAPSSFSTAAAGSTLFLNNIPDAAAATSASSSQLLSLPVGARIAQVVVSNNGTTVTGATTIKIGTQAWSASPAVSGATIANLMTIASINSTGGAYLGGIVTTLPLGDVGAPFPVLAALTTNINIDVTPTATVLTGDLVVVITYVL